jgi:hypothetical protein
MIKKPWDLFLLIQVHTSFEKVDESRMNSLKEQRKDLENFLRGMSSIEDLEVR